MSTSENSSATPPGSSCGSGRRRVYGDEERAQIVAYAKLHGIKASVEKYKVPRRTLHRWTSDKNPKTARRAVELTHAAGDKWADEVLSMAAAVILAGGDATLRRLADGARLEAKELHAWAGAMKLANDAKTTQQLLEQRKRPARPPAPPQKPAPVVAIGEGRAA